MNHLLDAHALLWYSLGDPKLSAAAHAVIRDPANRLLVSAATFWEIAIKVSSGKLNVGVTYQTFIDTALAQPRFALYPTEPRHFVAVAALPYPTTHRDPFDRILAVQAVADAIPVVRADAALDQYGVTRIW